MDRYRGYSRPLICDQFSYAFLNKKCAPVQKTKIHSGSKQSIHRDWPEIPMLLCQYKCVRLSHRLRTKLYKLGRELSRCSIYMAANHHQSITHESHNHAHNWISSHGIHCNGRIEKVGLCDSIIKSTKKRMCHFSSSLNYVFVVIVALLNSGVFQLCFSRFHFANLRI